MFVIRKCYRGREYAKVLNPDPKMLGLILAEELTRMSLDPNFTLSVEAQARELAPPAPPIHLPPVTPVAELPESIN